MLPCVVFFQNGVACDRAVGFDDYGATDDFSTTAVEQRLLKSGEMRRHNPASRMWPELFLHLGLVAAAAVMSL